MNKNWFEDWFNTSYYHVLYQNRNEAEASVFIDNLCKHLNIKSNCSILDLACGKGRHTLHLAKRGYKATGIDLAPKSIQEANKNAISNSKFEVHDMRKTYQLNSFDYVFNLFTSFGYFEKEHENIDVLRAVNNNLKEGGVFVLDFLNSKKTIQNLVHQETKILNDIRFDITRNYNGKEIIKTINVSDNAKIFKYQECVSAFTLDNIEMMASIAKLKVIEVFGDYNLNAFSPIKSDRLIIIMKAEK